jgi:N-acetylmuramoyl-L-alanine amidase
VKRISLILSALLVVFLYTQPSVAQYKIDRVVIDAGHGGKDPGAVGKSSMEKDIALAIALKTGAYISKYLPDVEVIYTRTTDKFVELYKRAEIANKSKADFFISIHCNASRSSSACGTETYVMGLHKSQANLEVAKLENAAILNEENFDDMYEGFDPNQDEDYITLTMFQDAFLEQSTVLADEIQRQFRDRVKRKDRGVFQAGFLVLYRTTMPGVLIETGFITNPNDERFLKSEDGQVYIASAIYRAFKQYKLEMERKDNKAQLVIKEDASRYNAANYANLSYRVQFFTSRSRKALTSRKFRDVPNIREYVENGLYKYTSGNFPTYDEALKHQKFIREIKKYNDAFIICFLGDKRITLEKALELTKK